MSAGLSIHSTEKHNCELSQVLFVEWMANRGGKRRLNAHRSPPATVLQQDQQGEESIDGLLIFELHLKKIYLDGDYLSDTCTSVNVSYTYMECPWRERKWLATAVRFLTCAVHFTSTEGNE